MSLEPVVPSHLHRLRGLRALAFHAVRPSAFVLLLVLGVIASGPLAATTNYPIDCGERQEGEAREADEFHVWTVGLRAGESMRFVIEPVGEQFQFRQVEIRDPAGARIFSARPRYYERFEHDSGVLSANGEHQIVFRPRTAGVYHLGLTCVRRDGTVVAPSDGDSEDRVRRLLDAGSRDGIRSSRSDPRYLATGELAEGTVDGEREFGVLYAGRGAESLLLQFERLAGPSELVVAVSGPEGEAVFAALVGSSEGFDAHLTLPSEGRYEIRVAASGRSSFPVPVRLRLVPASRSSP